MSERLSYRQQSPELFKKFIEFSFKVEHASIERSILDIVFMHASQLNGCAFCLDMHAKQAMIHGERPLRLFHLGAWRESPLFTPRERAALEWTEVLTRLPVQGVPDGIYEHVRTQLSEREISDLAFAITAINAWNRVNIAFATEPGSMDKEYGLDTAQLA